MFDRKGLNSNIVNVNKYGFAWHIDCHILSL